MKTPSKTHSYSYCADLFLHRPCFLTLQNIHGVSQLFFLYLFLLQLILSSSLLFVQTCLVVMGLLLCLHFLTNTTCVQHPLSQIFFSETYIKKIIYPNIHIPHHLHIYTIYTVFFKKKNQKSVGNSDSLNLIFFKKN